MRPASENGGEKNDRNQCRNNGKEWEVNNSAETKQALGRRNKWPKWVRVGIGAVRLMAGCVVGQYPHTPTHHHFLILFLISNDFDVQQAQHYKFFHYYYWLLVANLLRPIINGIKFVSKIEKIDQYETNERINNSIDTAGWCWMITMKQWLCLHFIPLTKD